MESGLPRFIPGFTCPALLRERVRRDDPDFAYGALTPFGRPFHAVRLSESFLTTPEMMGSPMSRPYNTSCSNAPALAHAWVWALALPLAATRAISFDFSSSGYLDVSVPRVAFAHPMCSGADTRALPRVGCPIRRSAADNGCLLLTAAYRS